MLLLFGAFPDIIKLLPMNFPPIQFAEAVTPLFYIRKAFSLNFGIDTNSTDLGVSQFSSGFPVKFRDSALN